MRKISINDWQLFSKRRNSNNYYNKDKTLILKTSSEKIKIGLDEFENELKYSNEVSSLGIKTPKILEVVEFDCGGYGIISEYIKNKKSISTAISEDFQNAEYYIKKFVDVAKKLHSTKCSGSIFLSFEEKVERVINS
ncbi:MAG: hypothetical protein MJ151_03745, partial [Lachnospiraceae bacterium]|nr:hypothetical protein [Lachnospiraceae bacterium]